MASDKKPVPKREGGEFERFQALTRRLLRVPKREIQEKAAEKGREARKGKTR